MSPAEIRQPGGRKHALHFGGRERPLFGFFHPPAEGPWRGVGVVLCPALGTDFTRADRAYRLLAERLAAAGFACLRFDLSATGDSGGAEDAPDLAERWLGDVGSAIDALRSASGAKEIALVGLRLGATLAALAAARRGDVSSLALWLPCPSGGAFVADVTKLHKLYLRIEPHLAAAPPPKIDGEEALGLFLPRAVVGQLAGMDLGTLEKRPAARALVLDEGGPNPGREALVTTLRALGTETEVAARSSQKLLITVSHRSLVPEDALGALVGWLCAAHPSRDASPVDPTWPSTPAPADERPLVVDGPRPLFGVLTPAAGGTGPGRPAIVLTNAGCVNRAGPHRTYVRMARRWASLGFDVLRLDLPGIGDSPAAPGEKDNLSYPPTAMEDLGRAMDALPASRFVIAGLCSGGDYAFQLAARDPRVAGAFMLNPRTFCVLALAAVESGAPPASPVDDVPRTLRALAERGVDTTLVVSRKDPGVTYVDTHAGDAMRALAGVPGYTRVDLDAADHSFTPVSLQEAVSDVLTARLAALSPSAR